MLNITTAVPWVSLEITKNNRDIKNGIQSPDYHKDVEKMMIFLNCTYQYNNCRYHTEGIAFSHILFGIFVIFFFEFCFSHFSASPP